MSDPSSPCNYTLQKITAHYYPAVTEPDENEASSWLALNYLQL